MGRLRHRTAPGCSFFIRTKAFQNAALFQASTPASIFVAVLFRYRQRGEYLLHAFVVMPNHVHLLITPSIRCSLERAMQLIMGGSAHEIHQQCGGRRPSWQSGFYEATIRNVADYESKVNYIHRNPVMARLVTDASDWKWSSASGVYTLDQIPPRLKPDCMAVEMSELKLRPPNWE